MSASIVKFMSARTLDQIMEEYSPSTRKREDETTLSIWVPVSLKDRYKQIQQKSGRTFSKVLGELVAAAIEKAESKSA